MVNILSIPEEPTADVEAIAAQNEKLSKDPTLTTEVVIEICLDQNDGTIEEPTQKEEM